MTFEQIEEAIPGPQCKFIDLWNKITPELFIESLQKGIIDCYFVTNDKQSKTLYVTKRLNTGGPTTQITKEEEQCIYDSWTPCSAYKINSINTPKNQLSSLYDIEVLHNPIQSLRNLQPFMNVFGLQS